MEHPETHLVTVENGPRPAGPPNQCFYCQQPLGQPHGDSCVCRVRTVVIRAVVEYVVNVPANWTPDDIVFHRNESSWCASNLLEELTTTTEGACLCHLATFEYVREASGQDEETCRPEKGAH